MLKVGREQNDAVIIDNLLTAPNELRNEALLLDYRKPDYPYPGVIAKPDWDFSAIERLVTKLLGLSPAAHRFTFRFSRVTLAGRELLPCQTIPHIDPVQVAGLIYLTPPEDCFGGTSFYRHRFTGVESLPARPGDDYVSKMNQFGYQDINKWAEYLLTRENPEAEYISDSTEEWEMTDLVEMKFNRLLIYNGKVFHSGYIKDGSFGNSKEQNRLTLNFFVQPR